MLGSLFAIAAIVVAVALGGSVEPHSGSLAGTTGDGKPFTANWMHHAMPFIEHLSLLNLSLPGTHDTMTYDLSTTISDGANDLPPAIAYLLHNFGSFLGITDYIRDQARTQVLNITAQLESGMRFIDFRMMFSAPPNDPSADQSAYDWYCLHLVQSKHTAMTYLQQAKAWIDAHPEEIVVFHFSRHGNVDANHYPGVNRTVMRGFWHRVEALFGDLLFVGQALNTTSIKTMLTRKQRVVVFLSNYEEMSGGSHAAIDSRQIDNQLGDQVSREPVSRQFVLSLFANASVRRTKDFAANTMYLLSMAGSAPHQQMLDGFFLRYFPNSSDARNISRNCAAAFRIPNMTSWCPGSLQAVAQLSNYYNQFLFETAVPLPKNTSTSSLESITPSYKLPMAFYIDAIDEDGTMRIGHELTGRTRRYDWVSVVVQFNVAVQGECRPGGAIALDDQCQRFLSLLRRRRAKFPLQLWSDPALGRHAEWPSN